MAASRLYNLPRPDRAADVELKDAPPEEIIKATYGMWMDAIPGRGYENAYEIACKMVRPFRSRFSGTLQSSAVPECNNFFKGLYLSALLNETNFERLYEDGQAVYAGHRLRPGKTIEIVKGERAGDLGTQVQATYVAQEAEGGAVINRTKVSNLGTLASNLTCINRGEVNGLCVDDRNPICINLGRVHSGICIGSHEPICINYSKKVSTIGYLASGGVFVTTVELERVFLDYSRGKVYGVGPSDIDSALGSLLEELKKYSEGSDIPKAEETARKVDKYVRKTYEPRKIA